MQRKKLYLFGISLIILVISIISYGCNAPNPSSEKIQSVKLYQSVTESSFKDITASKQRITEDMYCKIKNMVAANVMDYYDLRKTYNTELKWMNYKRTDDYNNKVLQMNKDKETALAKQYYIIYGENRKGEHYNAYKILDYNVYNNFIPIIFESELDDSGSSSYENWKSMHKIDMKMLPFEFENLYPSQRPPHIINKKLYLPMSSELGGIIENNRGSINVLVTFGLNDSADVKLPIELCIYNKISGKIYVVYTYNYN